MTTPSTPARRVRSLKVRRRPWTVKRSTIFDLHANPPSLPEPSRSPETAGLGREHPTGVDARSLLLEESAPVVAEDDAGLGARSDRRRRGGFRGRVGIDESRDGGDAV